MKIFLIGLDSQEVALELKKRGAVIMYWVCKKKCYQEASRDKVNFPETVFHHTFDAMKNLPTEQLSKNRLPLPAAEIFKQLAGCQTQVLDMMTRVDLDDLSFFEKRDFYHDYIIYWYGVLKNFSPDAILFKDIPHGGFNFVIYNLAKVMNIKTIIYKRTKGIIGGLSFFTDYHEYGRLKEEYSKIPDKEARLDNLSISMRNFYKKETAEEADFAAAHIKETYIHTGAKDKYHKMLPAFRDIMKNLRSGTFLKTTVNYLWLIFHRTRVCSLRTQYFYGWQLKMIGYKCNKLKNKYRKEYEALQSNPDFSRNYIFAPLHLQPECTTNPMGDEFDNQILMLETLADSLPENWVIYVKENPMQWKFPQGHTGRYSGYYNRLKKIKNVFLIPVKVSTSKMILNSKAVATITGTAAWEAVLKSKPALIFGHVWFMDCEGMFKISGPESCKLAMREIENGYKPDQQKVIKFLVAFERVMIRGFSNKGGKLLSGISVEENVKNIADAFWQELNSENYASEKN